MSRDIKYIGMDVHKEATVIAVLNGRGKLVMESIVETKPSSYLLYPRSAGRVPVPGKKGPGRHGSMICCNPRRRKWWSASAAQCLLKGRQQERQDRCAKLADLLRTGMLRPVYHGEHGLRSCASWA